MNVNMDYLEALERLKPLNGIHPMRVIVCQSGTLGQVQVGRVMYPGIEVIHMAGYLRHHLHQAEITIIDGFQLGFQGTITKLLQTDFDVLFIHGDTPTATAIYEIANRIKMNPYQNHAQYHIGIFGEHVSALPLEPFKRSMCDLVLFGDPEPVALRVCQAIQDARGSQPSLSSIANLAYRNKDGLVRFTARDTSSIDLNSLPPPARDLVDFDAYPGTFYKLSERETVVMAARGCPWKCIFCGPAGYRALQQPRFRFRSPKSLVDELEQLQLEYQINDFLIDITTFNFNILWAEEVCREIIGRHLKFNLKTHLRADQISEEMLNLMRQAGFWLIYMGIESAHDRSLAGIKKQVTIQEIENSLEKIHRAGIKTVGEFMNFLFWEEDETLQYERSRESIETLCFARRMFRRGLIHAMYWTAMTPLPASDSYAVALKHNLIPPEVNGKWHLWFPIQCPIVQLPGVTVIEWYGVQWFGKLHQLYFMIASHLLQPRLIRLIMKRGFQLLASAIRGLLHIRAFRGSA